MRGLPFKSTENDILEFFQPLNPASVHIIFDASGRPSGTAKVVFSTSEDVNAAMGKHKNLMEHRYIELFPGGL
jgi:RNA recognition motif-containing protein